MKEDIKLGGQTPCGTTYIASCPVMGCTGETLASIAVGNAVAVRQDLACGGGILLIESTRVSLALPSVDKMCQIPTDIRTF